MQSLLLPANFQSRAIWNSFPSRSLPTCPAGTATEMETATARTTKNKPASRYRKYPQL